MHCTQSVSAASTEEERPTRINPELWTCTERGFQDRFLDSSVAPLLPSVAGAAGGKTGEDSPP